MNKYLVGNIKCPLCGDETGACLKKAGSYGVFSKRGVVESGNGRIVLKRCHCMKKGKDFVVYPDSFLPRRRYLKDFIFSVLNTVKSGQPITMVAAQYGLNYQTIQKWLKNQDMVLS
jgi:hypothetical protein